MSLFRLPARLQQGYQGRGGRLAQIAPQGAMKAKPPLLVRAAKESCGLNKQSPATKHQMPQFALGQTAVFLLLEYVAVDRPVVSTGVKGPAVYLTVRIAVSITCSHPIP